MRQTFITAILLFWLSSLTGQSASVFSLMQQDSIVDIYLQLNWKELVKKKMDKTYLSGEVYFETTPGDTTRFNINVRCRGNMRLNICTYPPVKIKFNKSDLASANLKPLNEIDLVHNCHNGDQYDQFVLREYLAYKLYQKLSPHSYNVQLIRVHYLAPDGTTAYEPCIGYLVENSEELVDRLEAKRNTTATMTYNALDKASLLRVSLFEFMIGNTDWAIKNRHNLEFIGVPGIPFLVSVPFDFDYSGLVAAPYAVPHESIKLPSVAVRYYQGKCEPKEEVMKIVGEFLSKKEDLLNVCRTIPGMDERSEKYVVDYLTEFFSILENPKKLENHILSHCDMWPAAN